MTQVEDYFNENKHAGINNDLKKNIAKELVQFVNSLDPQLVIDAGCGLNPLKGKIQNLIGFDPVDNDGVDIIATIETAKFDKESADVVLALGSINYHEEDVIVNQINIVKEWLKPNGLLIMKGNPQYSPKVPRYMWTEEKVNAIAKKCNLQVDGQIETKLVQAVPRKEMIFWKYKK